MKIAHCDVRPRTLESDLDNKFIDLIMCLNQMFLKKTEQIVI